MYSKVVSVAIVVLQNIANVSAKGGGDFELTILHVNDVHSRFEETNIDSDRCSEEDKEENGCYGGFARLHSKVSELRQKIPNTLFLSGGDYFSGTIWYTLLKWKPVAYFLNIIQHDAMSFGNHEFDDYIPGVVPFLENVTFPVLGANINNEQEPTIQGKYNKSIVLEREGRKIGLVGYLTPDTLIISKPGKLVITDEIKAVREEAKRLKSEGVDIIIALGHSGFEKDIEIATQVEEVDVVVGGHTNTFLYTGENPSSEVSVDNYPFIATQSSGRKVPVVQAYAYGKYLGRLDLTFDNRGEVTSWGGNPILLDNTVQQDPDVLKELIPFREEVLKASLYKIGETYVLLDGQRLSCRMKECNIGNLLADSMVYQNLKYPDDLQWTHTALAVLPAGGIKSSIDEVSSHGNITMEDILAVAPMGNTIDIVGLKGVHVKEMFEHSISAYDPNESDPKGRFLQVSGFMVEYDINRPKGSQVARLQARCSKCRIPVLRPVVDNEIYKIAMPSYIAEGGDGYAVIKDNKVVHYVTGELDYDVLSNYIRATSPIHQGLENRILIIDSSNDLCPPSTNYSNNYLSTNKPISYENGALALRGISLILATSTVAVVMLVEY